MRLQDKVCIITGAGSGMGRVATRMFCAQGACVVAADVVPAAGEETVALARETGQGEAVFVRADVSREEDCANLVREAVQRYGRLDALYNNAGIMPEADHSVVDTPVQAWDQVQSVNLKGIYLCCKYGIPAMIDSGGGSVINVASFVALVGCSVPQDAYTASKGAVIALTKSLAVQFGPRGVRSNAICPGPIETPMLTEWLLSDPAARALRLNRIPMGRFGKPEDIVYLAIYLASDESTWTNGATLVVDGGITSNYF
jgi:NAD(P)-dependent dehydrogenase (short-subunit alcohol dehydrogenase family)